MNFSIPKKAIQFFNQRDKQVELTYSSVTTKLGRFVQVSRVWMLPIFLLLIVSHIDDGSHDFWIHDWGINKLKKEYVANAYISFTKNLDPKLLS